MNATQLKVFLVMSVIALTGIGPISITCLIGFYVVLARPRWFRETVRNLYRGKRWNPGLPPMPAGATTNTAATRIKCFLGLLSLFLLDIAPVPVAGSIGLYVVLVRPPWFYELAERLYGGTRV